MQRTGGKNIPDNQDNRSQGPEVQKAWSVPRGVTEEREVGPGHGLWTAVLAWSLVGL